MVEIVEVQADIAPKNPWKSKESATQEIKEDEQVVDYAQILGDNRLMFLAEDHDNNSIRTHVAAHAKDMKAAGITHYAIEAKEEGKEVFDKLNAGEVVDLKGVALGPARNGYEEAIRAMAAEGIKIVPVDIDQRTEGNRPTGEEREARMTANIMKILEDPEAKVAYLVGSFHSSKTAQLDGRDMTGKRLADAGISAVTVEFAGGEKPSPQVTDPARDAGLAYDEFMIDMHPYARTPLTPFGDNADYIIHLPQEFLNERRMTAAVGFRQEVSNSTRMKEWRGQPGRNRMSSPPRVNEEPVNPETKQQILKLMDILDKDDAASQVEVPKSETPKAA